MAIIHGETGESRSWIFFDIVTCGFRYGSGFNDYLLCEFYNLSNEQRATYVTRSINNALVSLLNDKQYYHVFDNKNEFYTTFPITWAEDGLILPVLPMRTFLSS